MSNTTIPMRLVVLCLTAACAFLLPATAAAQTTLFSDDFDGTDPGWTRVAPDGTTCWEMGNPTNGPGAANSGANCLATDLDADYDATLPPVAGAGSREGYITPPIFVGGYTSLQLSYFQYMDPEGFANNWDGGNIKVSVDGGATWLDTDAGTDFTDPPDAGVAPPYDTQLSNGWQNPNAGQWAWTQDVLAWAAATVDLGAFDGNATIMIMFDFAVDNWIGGDAGWFVDDVVVTGNPPANAFFDDFEGVDPGWTAQAPDGTACWEMGAPTVVGPPAAYGGARCLGTDLDANYDTTLPPVGANGSREGFITPAVNILGYTNLGLRFWHWRDPEGSTNDWDGGNLKVSVDGGGTWLDTDGGALFTDANTTVSPPYSDPISAGWGSPNADELAWTRDDQNWTQVIVNLTAFDGNASMLVMFDFAADNTAGGGAGWYLDEVAVTGTPPPLAPPQAPTTLYSNTPANTAQAGLTNPVNLATTTPVFSAVYTDLNADDSSDYQIQVAPNSDCVTGQVWDTGQTAMVVTSGNRCPDITYAGAALTDGVVYYWRIRFWDVQGVGAWSQDPISSNTFTMANNPPTAPTTLYSNTPAATAQAGVANPVGLDTWTPVFSAIYNDAEGYPSTQYWLQVASANDFSSGVVWNTGATAVVVANGARSPDITYGGVALTAGATYYWRIRFYDTAGAGTWSEDPVSTNTFTINPSLPPAGSAPLPPTTLYSQTPANTAQAGLVNPVDLDTWTPVFSAVHNDVDADSSTNYWIQVATESTFGAGIVWDSGATALVVANGARSSDLTYAGPLLTPLTTYYWRIRFLDVDGQGRWSEDIGTNTFTVDAKTAAPGNIPTAPTTLYSSQERPTGAQMGQMNPTNLDTWTPVFSAIHNEPDQDPATAYRIQVSPADDFSSSIVWDSGDMAISVNDGARCGDITYVGGSLTRDITYYWRIRFRDADGAGLWSETTSTNYFVIRPSTSAPVSTGPIGSSGQSRRGAGCFVFPVRGTFPPGMVVLLLLALARAWRSRREEDGPPSGPFGGATS